MRRLGWSVVAALAGLVGGAGCAQCPHRLGCPSGSSSSASPACDSCPRVPAPFTARAALLPSHPLAPQCQGCESQYSAPPCAACQTPTPAPPLAPAAAVEPSWGPSAGSGVRLLGPETEPSAAPPDAARLSPPEPGAPPAAIPSQPGGADTRPLPKGGVGEEPSATPQLPVGIPQFSMPGKQVAAGLRPISVDGLDWLASNGYRTVVHVRRPGQDDSSDRSQFEKRGLRYLSLEVSPETLSREVVERFNKAVNDAGNLPIFVYDKDGILAGGLWYLHFRLSEGAGDEDARARASRLGLRPDQEGEGKRMWLAVQKYLSEMKP